MIGPGRSLIIGWRFDVNPKELLVRRKAHLMFGGAFFLFMAFSIIVGLTTGQSFLGATWSAVRGIRPMDYLMFALFWYVCAARRRRDEWDSSLISLNLSNDGNS
jgi:hypothetical protein